MGDFNKYKRIFVIVLDSMGIGAMDDAALYGDTNVDTLGHIAEKMYEEGHFDIPNLQKLGLANLKQLKGVSPTETPMGRYMALNEMSKGKDTMTGHWEMMGLYITKPFKTFTDTGFPKELIDELEKRTGREVIGNRSASGTVILDELGEKEINENKLIVYTSADSCLQICGSEEVMGLDKLYEYCRIARELTMRDEWKVGRVIARPYTGKKRGEFVRTANRHDYALSPFSDTVLDAMKSKGLDVISVGKIYDIFNGKGLTESHKSKSSVHGMEQTIDMCSKDFTGMCFTNLVDFDSKWGHRRDPIGYGCEIEAFDKKLGQMIEKIKEDDLIIITADHGNDPTYTGSDHTREKVPFLAYSKSYENSNKGKNTGGSLFSDGREADTFAVIGATVADNFYVKMPENTIGHSLLDRL